MTDSSGSYQGIELLAPVGADAHLGGNARWGDPYTFSPTVWGYMVSRFGVRRVLDLGSGIGNAALWFYRAGCQVVAVDGFEQNTRGSVYPVIVQDLTLRPVICEVDLVYCQEVVEHIDAAYIEHLMTSLTNAPVVLITHAVPGQLGHHHVNCQPSEYWIERFRERGYVQSERDTEVVRAHAATDGAVYLRNTGLVFLKA